MDKLKAQVTAISASATAIGDRLGRIEKLQLQDGDGCVGPDPNAHVGEQANVNQDIQASFISIKAALANLRVPASLAVPTDKTGIKKADQSQHNLITKVARYSETIIKLLQTPGLADDQRLADILITEFFSFAAKIQ